MDGVGVDERDLEAEEAGARLLVDQVRACAREACERLLEVGHLVRDVVHAGAALGEEALERARVPQRLEQLDVRAVLELQAEDGAYVVAIPHVTYVKRFSRESRVGFGG